MKKVLFVFLFMFIAQFSNAQDEAMKKDALKVIEVSGALAQMQLAKDQIAKQIPAEKRAAFLIEFDATMPELYAKVAKIYTDMYTKEDLKAMLAFYESPVGKKISANAAPIAEKSMQAGQEWGTSLQTLMMKYMQ